MYPIFKRLIDILAAGLGIVVLLPLAIPVFIALRLTGEGEVFYRQKRLGYRQQPFHILKLATMLKNSPTMSGGEITLRNDPRVTPLGRYLRQFKLNELPQLWNVLIGDMTIIGPRPLMKVSFEMYAPDVQAIVYECRPGLTGIGSLVFRDEEALVTDCGRDPREFYEQAIYPYKGELERWYHANQSAWTDLKILLLTPILVVAPGTDLVFSWFPTLPPIPDELRVGAKGAGSSTALSDQARPPAGADER